MSIVLDIGCRITAAPRGSALEPPLAPGGWELRSQTPALLLLLGDILVD